MTWQQTIEAQLTLPYNVDSLIGLHAFESFTVVQPMRLGANNTMPIGRSSRVFWHSSRILSWSGRAIRGGINVVRDSSVVLASDADMRLRTYSSVHGIASLWCDVLNERDELIKGRVNIVASFALHGLLPPVVSNVRLASLQNVDDTLLSIQLSTRAQLAECIEGSRQLIS